MILSIYAALLEMIMNYNFDFAAIIVVGMAIICSYYRPYIFKMLKRTLGIVFFLALLYAFSDIMASIFLDKAGYIAYKVSYLWETIRYLSGFWISYFLMKFIYELCNEHFRNGIYAIPATVLSLLLVFFNNKYNLFFGVGDGPFFFRGPLAICIILLFLLMYIGTGTCINKHLIFLGKIRYDFINALLVIGILGLIYEGLEPAVSLSSVIISVSVTMLVYIIYYVDVTYDDLTGINNRNGFVRECQELINKSADISNLYIFKVEIYNLDDINERFGSKTGDKILQKLSNIIIDSLDRYGHKYVIGRVSGDDFGIMTRFDTNMKPIMDYNIKDILDDDSIEYDYIISIYAGLCNVNIEGDEPNVNVILDRAEYALSKVRGSFNKHMEIYDGNIKEENENIKELEQKVRGAIENNEFKVYLQPIYDTNSKNPVSAEALVRWVDSNNKIISPGEFIPLFEKNGFITRLDLIVLSKVCVLIRKWMDMGVEPLPVSVNISRVDMLNPHIQTDIINIVNKYKVPHEYIKIELTESGFNYDDQRTRSILEGLHNAGFLIMMDDFGSGYSNLNMFKDMPVDTVKIDMNFLRNIDKSERGRIVVESVVSMAKKMGLTVVIEGVETQTQYDFIRKLECEMIQGYYFSKPLPSVDFEEKIFIE